MTHNQIVAFLQEFADQHGLINSHEYGDIAVATFKKHEEFPKMLIVPGQMDFVDNDANFGGTINSSFDVYLFDVPAKKNDPQRAIREIVSDMTEVAADLRAAINASDLLQAWGMRAVRGYTILPIIYDFAETVSGVMVSFAFEHPQIGERCEIPYIIGTPAPVNPCPTLCELISDEDWLGIKDCMNDEQIAEAVNDLCEPCPPGEDATAVLKDTDGNILSTTNIPSGDTEDITAPDGSVTVNNTAFGSALSGGSLNVPVQREGVDIGSLIGSIWVIPQPANIYSMRVQPTSTVNYATYDTRWRCNNNFYNPQVLIDIKSIRQLETNAATLSAAGFEFGYMMTENNYFGNKARFTLLNGSYALKLDDWRDVNGTPIATPGTSTEKYDYLFELVWWDLLLSTGVNWANSLKNPATYTLNGKTGWFLASRKEYMTLTNENLNNRYFALVAARGARTWTSDTDPNNTANAMAITSNGLTSLAKTTTASTSALYCRHFDSNNPT